MIRNAYSRKKRQLKNLSKQLNLLLLNEANAASAKAKQLAQKIKQLILELRPVISRVELRKIVGGVAVLFGLSLSPQIAAQSFNTPVTNPFGISATLDLAFPTFADLDNDGDLDLMVGEYLGDIKYFKNNGTAGLPQFAAPVSAPFGIDTNGIGEVAAPALVDLDGDGDLDLMVGSSDYYYPSNNLLYFENTGSPTAPQFGVAQTSPFGISPTNLFALPTFVDLDADGDLDMMAGEYNGVLAYYENTGTATTPQFAAPQSNPFGLQSTYLLAAPAFADLDKDGDFDLLVGEVYNYYGGGVSYGANLQYFENTGTAAIPQFAAPVTNPFGITPGYYQAFPAFADLDNDGDADLMVGEYYGNMKYFEDTTASSGVGMRKMPNAFSLNVYPVPASDYIEINSPEPLTKVQVLDMSRKEVLMTENIGEKIPIKHLAPGQYLLKATNQDGKMVSRKLQIQ